MESFSGCAAPPCIDDKVSEPVLSIPAQAYELSFWFYCIPMGSGTAAAYDSNDGANFNLDVSPRN